MKIPPMIAAEFRRLTSSPMSIIALIALTIVPILYGGLYLWANQDPYDRLDQVPAAIVVDDKGTEVAGTYRNYGDEVAEQLIESGDFDWHRVTASSAEKGVDVSKFDFSITIAADFSEALVSAAGDEPRQALVTLTTNDANSYLASTIGEQAAKTIRESIVKQVNREAADRLLTGLATVRDNLGTASEGAAQLRDGAATAQNGAGALADGAAQLNLGAETLAGGSRQLADGASQVAAGNETLASYADRAAEASAELAAALPGVRNDIAARLQQAGASQEQIDAALAALDPLGSDLTTGNERVQQVRGQIDTLAAGARDVAAGAQQIADGSATLAANTPALVSGAQQLTSGLDTLHGGLATLHDGLADGVEQIPASSTQLRDKQAGTIADPVDLKNTAVTAAGTYGAGLAPFFVALAAWIGIYALFLIVKPVSRRAITALHSPVKITVAGWLTPGILGAIQMIGLFTVVAGALGFRIENPLATYGVMALSSLCFTAIILALNVWLGSVGQFLGLVLMVLQLVTAGGTFPWQTLPEPLASLHHVFPMSYSVDALRQLMYGGNLSAATTDVWVLVAWLAVGLLLAAIGVARMTRFRTLRDLQPSLIG